MSSIVKGGTPVNLSASGQVSKIGGSMLGFYVATTSTGIITFEDALAAGQTAFTGSITPAVGWNAFPVQCALGLHMTLVSGSINVTVVFAAG